MGFSSDLTATTLAVCDTIAFLADVKQLSRNNAYMLTSVAVNVENTQFVDGNVHTPCVYEGLSRSKVGVSGVVL